VLADLLKNFIPIMGRTFDAVLNTVGHKTFHSIPSIK
jgi:hypothetical protein